MNGLGKSKTKPFHTPKPYTHPETSLKLAEAGADVAVAVAERAKDLDTRSAKAPLLVLLSLGFRGSAV